MRLRSNVLTVAPFALTALVLAIGTDGRLRLADSMWLMAWGAFLVGLAGVSRAALAMSRRRHRQVINRRPERVNAPLTPSVGAETSL
jgi:hypothetical protein